VLGTRYELGLSWIVPQLGALARAHPEITLHLYFGSGDDLLGRLRTREIDCAVTSARFSDPQLAGVRLHPEHYVFVAARSLLARHALSRPEHADAHALIDASADLPLFRYWRDAPGGGDRLRFGRVWRVGTIAAIERLVSAGLGVAVLPEYLVAKALKRETLSRVFPSVKPISDCFRLVYRTDDPRRPSFHALAATMRKAPLC
jgi:DNA-binding transcriptional LysR family regulator